MQRTAYHQAMLSLVAERMFCPLCSLGNAPAAYFRRRRKDGHNLRGKFGLGREKRTSRKDVTDEAPFFAAMRCAYSPSAEARLLRRRAPRTPGGS